MKQYKHENLVRVSYLFMEDTQKLQKDYPGLTSIILYAMTKVKEADGHSLRNNADSWTFEMISECRDILFLSRIPDSVRFLIQQILLVLRGQEGDKEAMRLAGIQRFGTGRWLGKAKNAARRKAVKLAEFKRTLVENGSGAQQEFQEAQLRQWNNWRRSPTLVGKEVPPHLIGMCKH